VCDGEAEVLQGAFEDVVGEEGSEVSHVGVVVDGGAAGVHGNLAGDEWFDGLFG